MGIKDDNASDDVGRVGACQCHCHWLERTPAFLSVGYAPAEYAWPRKGFIGKILDSFIPRYRPNIGYSGYIAYDAEGRMAQSHDGITWTTFRPIVTGENDGR